MFGLKSASASHPLVLALDQISSVIVGKESAVRLALTCLLARGHLLIEDLPGMGKTTLAHALAETLGLRYQRIQFTSDLLPADILGASVFSGERFVFHPGPIFAQVVLADEINRATPKSQSALLESMEEGQVTTEGETRDLPDPFFVIATQNPSEQVGTFPLPESQLDRFMMRIELGYPDSRAERSLLEGEDRRALLNRLGPSIEPDDLLAHQRQVDEVAVAGRLLDYIQALLNSSRDSGRFRNGLSPRAGLSLLRAARAWAHLEQRSFVIPEDVQAVLPAVVGHRLATTEERSGTTRAEWLQEWLASVEIPL